MKNENIQNKDKSPYTISVVLIRHAQSQWNRENRYYEPIRDSRQMIRRMPVLIPRYYPGAGNLAQTRTRVSAFWAEQIVPRIQKGERIQVSNHGNTLRALLMDLADMSVEQVEIFEIPTATPIVYKFNREAKPLDWYYLATYIDEAKSA